MFKKNSINHLVSFLLLALAIGFFVSRALVSIAIIFLFLLALFYKIKYRTPILHHPESTNFKVFTGFYILIIMCSLFTAGLNCILDPTVAYAPFFLLPFAFKVFDEELIKSKNTINLINSVFIGGILILLVDMVLRQGFNPEKIIRLAHDSKNVSNFLDIHHNIVGLLSVFSILYLAETYKLSRKPIMLILMLLMVVLIHYLGLRFALMAFYPLIFIYLLRLRIKKSIKIWVFSFAALLLIASFVFIPAFNARYRNTKADFLNIIEHKNPNYYSINQRLIANEIGLQIAQKNWLLGVGTCNIKDAVAQEYKKNSRLLIPENRKFIHNQLIYGWATFGIFYVFGWTFLFGYLIYRGIKKQSILLEITLLFLMHQLVENTLEKQLMLMLFLYFAFLMPIGLEKSKVKGLK